MTAATQVTLRTLNPSFQVTMALASASAVAARATGAPGPWPGSRQGFIQLLQRLATAGLNRAECNGASKPLALAAAGQTTARIHVVSLQAAAAAASLRLLSRLQGCASSPGVTCQDVSSSLAMPAGPCSQVDEARRCSGLIYHDRPGASTGATEASLDSSGHSPGSRLGFSRRRLPAPRMGRGLSERTGHASRPAQPNIAGAGE